MKRAPRLTKRERREPTRVYRLWYHRPTCGAPLLDCTCGAYQGPPVIVDHPSPELRAEIERRARARRDRVQRGLS